MTRRRFGPWPPNKLWLACGCRKHVQFLLCACTGSFDFHIITILISLDLIIKRGSLLVEITATERRELPLSSSYGPAKFTAALLSVPGVQVRAREWSDSTEDRSDYAPYGRVVSKSMYLQLKNVVFTSDRKRTPPNRRNKNAWDRPTSDDPAR